ncbi:MAG: DUF4296 domain-containing protein [Tangfeifania sp.]
MKKLLYILSFVFLVAAAGCDEPPVPEPENLIDRARMIEMLADIHLAEATFNSLRHRDSIVEKSSSANFYYSILDKYQVQDTVFEQSFVFYASQPRQFEKMYREAMNILNEMEQEYSGRKNDLLDVDVQERKK